ncbi:hypothetical protein ACFYZE_35330 [Streptomyces sp. NPDC001796]|uniref:hypothetical protein n=1 Tax=Streptomyces sp. NPDC001796 TaxID=3364609 RepID=UPI0036929946
MRAFKRFAVAASAAAVLAVPLATAAAAAANEPRQTDPPSGATPWSDCFYGHPLPHENAYVDSFGNDHVGIGITLRCGRHDSGGVDGWGVRHIKDGHGYDDYTDYCIQLIVTHSTSLSPGSGARNMAFKYSAHGMTGTVIYNVDTKNIVTAFTSGTRDSGDWHGCVSKFS